MDEDDSFVSDSDKSMTDDPNECRFVAVTEKVIQVQVRKIFNRQAVG